MFAEHFGNVTRSGISARDINHGLVHADIAYDRTTFAADIDLTAIIGEPAVETVGIADRDNSDNAVLGEFGMPPVPYRLTGFDGLDGKDGRLERADIA